MKTKTAWKVLNKGMKSSHGNIIWKKGKWQVHKGDIELCNSGLHASKLLVDAIQYVTPGIICKVEYKGDYKEQQDKFVCTEMRVIETYRFTKRKAVEFSIYCARQCLKNFEKELLDDKRPRKAIEAAENWLKNPTKKNIQLAESAAQSATQSAWSAESAVWSATRLTQLAAESAAWSARSAESAVWSATRLTQLAAESAAESARSAAESAVWSARSAARSAAESAAVWSAAVWSAQLASMKKGLEKRLLKIIGDEK